jgi:hypothetical protein
MFSPLSSLLLIATLAYTGFARDTCNEVYPLIKTKISLREVKLVCFHAVADSHWYSLPRGQCPAAPAASPGSFGLLV